MDKIEIIFFSIVGVLLLGMLLWSVVDWVKSRHIKNLISRAKLLKYTDLERNAIIDLMVAKKFYNKNYEANFDKYNRKHSIAYPSPDVRVKALIERRQEEINKFISNAVRFWSNHKYGEAVGELLDYKALKHFVRLKEIDRLVEIILG